MDDDTEIYLNKLKNKMKQKLLKNNEENKMNIEEEEEKEENNNNVSNNENGDDLWRVGIICKKECYELTQDILNILKEQNYEWRVISCSYKIKCRKKQDENKPAKNNNPEIPQLNILIQIFGEVDSKEKDEFLVDFHKLSGPVMEFLDFSSMLITEMRKQGLIVVKK